MKKHRKEIIIGMIITLAIIVFLSPLASSNPDGLEKVAEDKQFIHMAEGKEMIESPIPDYLFPGLENEVVSGILAGIIGIFLVFGFMIMMAKIIGMGKKEKSNESIL